MTRFEKIIYFACIMGWISAPFIVKAILASRNIFLPSDISIGGVAIWYAIPVLQMAWFDRNNPKQNRGNKDISYRDKGQNDWLHRD